MGTYVVEVLTDSKSEDNFDLLEYLEVSKFQVKGKDKE